MVCKMFGVLRMRLEFLMQNSSVLRQHNRHHLMVFRLRKIDNAVMEVMMIRERLNI